MSLSAPQLGQNSVTPANSSPVSKLSPHWPQVTEINGYHAQAAVEIDRFPPTDRKFRWRFLLLVITTVSHRSMLSSLKR
jgi:hypothetical protein